MNYDSVESLLDMPGAHYFWDMESIPIPYIERRSVAKVVEKLRAKFGNGPVVAVGDEAHMEESGNAADSIKSIPFVEFIHVPHEQKSLVNKILLQKIKERFWARGDILVVLAGDGALNKDLTMLKSQGVIVNIIGNRLNELYMKLQETAGRSYIFQWSEVLSM